MKKRRTVEIPLADTDEVEEQFRDEQTADWADDRLTVRTDEVEPPVIRERLPILPLRDMVVFPRVITPLLVGRERSVYAIQVAMERDRIILLLAQRDQSESEPKKSDLYRVGVAARILQILKLPNGLFKVLVEGLVRAEVEKFLSMSWISTLFPALRKYGQTKESL